MNRKFLGNSNSLQSKPQQSRLFFGKPKPTGVGQDSEQVNDGLKDGKGEATSVPGKNDDPEDIMNGMPEKVEADGEAAEAQSAQQDETMSDDKDKVDSAKRKSSHKSPKRSQAEMKAEEDDDEDEPVLKRSRKGRVSKSASKDKEVVQSQGLLKRI